VSRWQKIDTAPKLEAVLTCQAGRAKSIRLMYHGDGNPKHPYTWICEVTREPVSDFEMPDFWQPPMSVPCESEEP